MSNLPSELVEIFKAIGLTKDEATWDCHGTPVALHKALEQVAAYKGIAFDPPVMVEAHADKKTVAMIVSGRLGDKVEWSVGEAAPYNNKNSYPYAMAEKRAKDRVILKLIGVAGFVYSEDEADDFKKDRPENLSGAPTKSTPPPCDEIPLDETDMWQQWVDAEKQKIQGFDELYQMMGWGKATKAKRDQLGEFSREMLADLKDTFKTKHNELNTGER
tara:strand:+ start:162 stop:812 length:651 start_codon:yes stop_codon:yes gene_type:complete